MSLLLKDCIISVVLRVKALTSGAGGEAEDIFKFRLKQTNTHTLTCRCLWASSIVQDKISSVTILNKPASRMRCPLAAEWVKDGGRGLIERSN